MENMDCRDSDLEESFSFSSYDFMNSSMGVFSDDEEDDDDESYYEIALQPTLTKEGETDDLELRISFSSVFPFPELSGQSLTHNLLSSKPLENPAIDQTSSSSTSTLRSSCSGGGDVARIYTCAPKTPGPPEGSELSPDLHKTTRHRRVQFPVINRVVNILMSTLRVSSTEITSRPQQNGRVPINTGNWKLVRSRKASKVTTAINSGVVKFFIKFRSIKIQSMFASFLKPRVISAQGDREDNIIRRSEEPFGNHGRLIKPFDKWLVPRDRGKGSNNNINNNSFGNGEKSRMLEINLDAIRGVLESMSMSIGRKDKQTKSCPSSIKSSPVHKGSVLPSETKIYARENSVQAAIAHCKRSYGQTPDICM